MITSPYQPRTTAYGITTTNPSRPQDKAAAGWTVITKRVDHPSTSLCAHRGISNIQNLGVYKAENAMLWGRLAPHRLSMPQHRTLDV
jgi:hypothetical protein